MGLGGGALNKKEWGAMDRFAGMNTHPAGGDYRQVLHDYLDTASQAAATKPWGMGMGDFMYTARGSALSRAMLGGVWGEHGWDPEYYNHYNEFAKGPLYGYMQLQHEAHDLPNSWYPQLTAARDAVRDDGLRPERGSPQLTHVLHRLGSDTNGPINAEDLPSVTDNILRDSGVAVPAYHGKRLTPWGMPHNVYREHGSAVQQIDPKKWPSFTSTPAAYQTELNKEMGTYLAEKGFKPSNVTTPSAPAASHVLPGVPTDPSGSIPFSDLHPGIPKNQQFDLLSGFQDRLKQRNPGLALRMQLENQALGGVVARAPKPYGEEAASVRHFTDKAWRLGLGAAGAGLGGLALWAWLRHRRKEKEEQENAAQQTEQPDQRSTS
jgi:hypothetical protein